VAERGGEDKEHNGEEDPSLYLLPASTAKVNGWDD